jgi:hypothetical protein
MTALLVAFCVVSSFMAVSPVFHHWLHDDSETSAHQCVVTLLQQQQITPATPITEAPVFEYVLSRPAELSQSVCLPSVALEVASCRAPPSFFVS